MEIVQNNKKGENTSNGCNNTEFPEGMRVLAVDDNVVCLRLLTTLLEKCRYQVTSLSNKAKALEQLKQNADNFDIVLTNVYIDEREGFKLLEAGQELNIPVIMISASESRDIILKGVRYGAVDYLIKPIRLEIVKTIWQHVYRKKLACSRSTPLVNEADTTPINNDDTEEVRDGLNRTSGNLVSDDRIEEIQTDVGTSKGSRKSCKKDRISWTKERKEKFIAAVQILGGIDKAVPKKILELMDEPVTREQVASHLQKVRKGNKEKQNREQTDLHHHQKPLGSTSVGASSILGNALSRGGPIWLNYQRLLNYNRWQMTPSIGYTTPTFRDRPNDQSILQQPRMMFNSGNILGPSSSKPIESILQLPRLVSNDGNFMDPSSSKPIESILQQPKMVLKDENNIMGSSSRCKPEELHIPDDPRLQLPEVVFDQGPSTMDSIYESYLLNDIFSDIASEYPTSLDFLEDDNKDFRNS